LDPGSVDQNPAMGVGERERSINLRQSCHQAFLPPQATKNGSFTAGKQR
jgi:hypothetical protein